MLKVKQKIMNVKSWLWKGARLMNRKKRKIKNAEKARKIKNVEKMKVCDLWETIIWKVKSEVRDNELIFVGD